MLPEAITKLSRSSRYVQIVRARSPSMRSSPSDSMRLHRQMSVPLDPLAELGGSLEREKPALLAGGEIPQLEVDRLEMRRKLGRAAVIRDSPPIRG